MPDYILLEGSPLNNRVRVVVHSDVPPGNNAVGVAWSDALVGHLDSTVSRVPAAFLPAGRQTALDNGTVYEWEFTFSDDANKTPANRLTALEAEISAKESDEQTRLANLLRFYGHTGSI